MINALTADDAQLRQCNFIHQMRMTEISFAAELITDLKPYQSTLQVQKKKRRCTKSI